MKKTAVYFCNCGTIVSEKIDSEKVRQGLADLPDVACFKCSELLCSEEGQAFLEKDVRETQPDRVVIAACSPREHEATFMKALTRAGMNPYLMQMVNIREQVAWVTEDREKATAKATRYVRAAVQRTSLQTPLEGRSIDVQPGVLVLGAGPAGMKAALSIAESGRKAILVERSAAIGGLPVRYEEVFPNMECGPCMLEPFMGEVLHGHSSENIELLTLADLEGVVGSYGNFTATIRRRPRFVNTRTCIGCAECVGPCPVTEKNSFNFGMNDRKAIDFPYPGALPNAPFIDWNRCLRRSGEDCHLCRDACPVENCVDYADAGETIERSVGAIVLATGAFIYDCSKIPNLLAGDGVLTSLEFERLAASNGPTGGQIQTAAGQPPCSVAIVHCAGGLDSNHKSYCSEICCQYALKFNHAIRKQHPDAKILHLYKELVLPGKDAFGLRDHAMHDANTTFARFEKIEDLAIRRRGRKRFVSYKPLRGRRVSVEADLIVLCPPVVPGEGAQRLAELLDVTVDRFGFFEELHGKTDIAQSKLRGIYLAGSCQAPMDIGRAMTQGMAAAGFVLSGLPLGKKLEISPVTASIDADRCSGCRTCMTVCPYKAISFDPVKEVSVVNDLLCEGCGTCVAACPSGVITGNHFTNAQIYAELEGMLA